MIEAKKHIAIICSRLDLPGGIERITVNTANLFAANHHPVSLLILDETDKSFYPIHPSITIKQFPLFFGITEKGNKLTRKIQFIKNILKLKSVLKETNADTIIATEYPFAIAIVLTGIKKTSKIYSWEHQHYGFTRKNFFWKTLFNWCYPKLHGILCITKFEADYFNQFAPASVIPYHIENKTAKKSSVNSKTILSVGWLIRRKGIDFIMKASKIIFDKHPDWKWKIIGKGEMKNELLTFIKKEKLEDKLIIQQPVSSNIDDEYCNASLFVLASRFEAFPMVLLEALSFGVPCISFDCHSGPSDIITNNEDGILVEKENAVKLAEAINKLIEDEELRNKMSEAAFRNVLRFSPKIIYKEWQRLLTADC